MSELKVDPVLGAIILAVLGGIGWLVKWYAGRIPPRVDPAAQVAALAETQRLAEAKHDKEMGVLMDRLDESESRQRILEDYVEELRFHISTSKPPPPPPWPSALQRETR